MTAPASGEPLADHPCPADTGTASECSDPVDSPRRAPLKCHLVAVHLDSMGADGPLTVPPHRPWVTMSKATW